MTMQTLQWGKEDRAVGNLAKSRGNLRPDIMSQAPERYDVEEKFEGRNPLTWEPPSRNKAI